MKNRPRNRGLPAWKEEVEWDPASIFEHVLRRMSPRPPFHHVHLEFRPFAGMNHTVRLRQGRMLVRLSDLLEGAPPAVMEAIAAILLAKLFGRPVPAGIQSRYRGYVNSGAVRRRIQRLRRLRGRKRTGPVQGSIYDLGKLFEKLNRKYFGGLLAQPGLAWSRSLSRSSLGHFDPAHRTVVISRILDRRETPPLLVEFILYHEMLHLKYPVEVCDGRRRMHSSVFRREEKKFERYQEARAALRSLLVADCEMRIAD